MVKDIPHHIMTELKNTVNARTSPYSLIKKVNPPPPPPPPSPSETYRVLQRLESGVPKSTGGPRLCFPRSSGFPTWSDTNQAVQPQKIARGLKFQRNCTIRVVKTMALISYAVASLFSHTCKKPVFSQRCCVQREVTKWNGHYYF